MRQVRRHPDRRRQRPHRRHRQQPPRPRPDPGFLSSTSRCGGVLRRGLPRLCARSRRPREHHLRQARHRPLQGVRLQGRHRLHRSCGQFLDFNMGPPPYPLEYILRDATGPTAVPRQPRSRRLVIVDYPFITGRSTPDSYLTGEKMSRGAGTAIRRCAAGWWHGFVADGRPQRRDKGSHGVHDQPDRPRASSWSSCAPMASPYSSAIPGASEEGLLDEPSELPDLQYILALQEAAIVCTRGRLRPGDAPPGGRPAAYRRRLSATGSAASTTPCGGARRCW